MLRKHLLGGITSADRGEKFNGAGEPLNRRFARVVDDLSLTDEPRPLFKVPRDFLGKRLSLQVLEGSGDVRPKAGQYGFSGDEGMTTVAGKAAAQDKSAAVQ